MASRWYMCLDTTVYVSSDYYVCVRILPYITTESPTVLMASRWSVCVLILLYVSFTYYYGCVLILRYITTESPTVLMGSRWTFHTATSKRQTSRSDHPTRWWLRRLCMEQGWTPSADSPSTSLGPFVTSSSSKRPFGSLSPTLLSNKINQTCLLW